MVSWAVFPVPEVSEEDTLDWALLWGVDSFSEADWFPDAAFEASDDASEAGRFTISTPTPVPISPVEFVAGGGFVEVLAASKLICCSGPNSIGGRLDLRALEMPGFLLNSPMARPIKERF